MDVKRLLIAFCLFFLLSVCGLAFLVSKTNEIVEPPVIESEKENADEEVFESDLNRALSDANERKGLEKPEQDEELLVAPEIEDTEEISESDVCLVLSTVAHDIRIRIMDDESLISGNTWVADIVDSENNLTRAMDEDLDGLISVPNLSCGEYYVSLEPQSGYRVPSDPTRVMVRDIITYEAIPSISFEIKTEDEIDASKEDTGFLDETDEGINKDFIPEGIKGIDVSKWNKSIDWSLVKASGVEYAIIRCGYRGSSTGTLVEDPYWSENLHGAKENGLKVGVYFFSQAISEAEAIEEASACIALIGDEKIDYPVFLDVEGSGGRGDYIDNGTRTNVINAFCNTIKSAGIIPGVYANKNWFNTKINTSELSGITKWLAQYNVSAPTYEGEYDLWQYTSKGSVPGIEGNVDIDISYIDF